MKRTISLLTLLLVVQLGLAFALHWGQAGDAGAEEGRKLLDIAVEKVDGIELTGPDGGRLLLEKGPDGWRLPEHFAAAADAAKVAELLSRLDGLTRPWPTARTAEAGRRFKVDEKDFELRLTLRGQEEAMATLLLGSSPGFRKVHARLSGEEPIYDIPFSTYEASLKAEDWVDRGQLQIAPERISAIALPDCRLIRDDGKMRLENLSEAERTDREKAGKLLERLAGLRIRDIYGKADQPLPNPVELNITLTLKDGGSRNYAFAKGGKGDYDLLRVSDVPYLFKVAPGLVKELGTFDRAQLAQVKPEAGQESAG